MLEWLCERTVVQGEGTHEDKVLDESIFAAVEEAARVLATNAHLEIVSLKRVACAQPRRRPRPQHLPRADRSPGPQRRGTRPWAGRVLRGQCRGSCGRRKPANSATNFDNRSGAFLRIGETPLHSDSKTTTICTSHSGGTVSRRPRDAKAWTATHPWSCRST